MDRGDDRRGRVGGQDPVDVDRLPPLVLDATTSAPQRAATSVIRWPKSPLTATTTTSPGWTVLTKAASIPAEPVALNGRVRALEVPQAVRSISQVSSMIRRNSGSRWPSSGLASARVASA